MMVAATTLVAVFAGVSMGGAAEPVDGSLSGLIADFLQRHGQEPTPEQVEIIAQMDALPSDVRDGLAQIITSFGVLEGHGPLFQGAQSPLLGASPVDPSGVYGAYGDLLGGMAGLSSAMSTPSAALTWSSEFFSQMAVGSDLGYLVEEDFSAVVDSGSPGLVTLDHSGDACVRIDNPPAALSVPPALNIDLTGTDNVYTADFLLSIDTCGDDTYHNNGGGSRVASACALLSGVSAFFDLGGDDQYGNPAAPRGCGANGGASGGIGMLVDAFGDDTYVAGQQGTNGGALMGVGLLLDAEGADNVTGTFLAVNGAGVQGFGHLVNFGGSDKYTATFNGVNGGAAQGTGLLLDVIGDDQYSATTNAVNGGGANGLGRLIDRQGTDQYFDLDGGAGTDVTVLPKGTVGMQIDA